MRLVDSVMPPGRHGMVAQAVVALSALTAMLGTALLIAIALLSCASIALRATGFEPILGDYEIVQLGLAASVAWLLQ